MKSVLSVLVLCALGSLPARAALIDVSFEARNFAGTFAPVPRIP